MADAAAEIPPEELEELSFMRKLGRFLSVFKMGIFSVAWPLFCLPFLIIYDSNEMRCGFVILVMAGYWITECIPMGVTSFLPIIFFPVFGILDSYQTCQCYMNDTVLVLIGGLSLATAIEHSKLHLRIALFVMKTVGCSHARLLGGLCIVTTFASMWVSNTAATAMMLPVVFAVLGQLEQAGYGQVFVKVKENPDDVEGVDRPSKITKAYLVGAAYCATFGGTGTLVGTGTNLTFRGIYESIFPDGDEIAFGKWSAASIPQMVISSFITWVYCRMAFLGFLRPKSNDAKMAEIDKEGKALIHTVIIQRYKDLGGTSFHEIAVAMIFLVCVFLWIFRHPGFMTGWAELITDVECKDSVPVMLAIIVMFLVPRNARFYRMFKRSRRKRPRVPSEGLLTWPVLEQKIPWGLVFLLGGGFAISKGSTESCLAKRIGESLVTLRVLPPLMIMVLTCLFVGTITEFTSNVGIANITLPVIAQMSLAMELHPLYLMIPATLACSYSFRLPVGTPPNALIQGAGNMKTIDLITAGCVPSIYSLIVMALIFPTWGALIFNTRGFPDWATTAQNVNDTGGC